MIMSPSGLNQVYKHFQILEVQYGYRGDIQHERIDTLRGDPLSYGKKMTDSQAAACLGLSTRQIIRIKKRVFSRGLAGSSMAIRGVGRPMPPRLS